MMDATPMYAEKLWHPQAPWRMHDYMEPARPFTHSERPVQYFYINFGLSWRYSSEDTSPQELPIFGGDKTVPEFQHGGYDAPADPYRTDIYYLGNLIRRSFLNVRPSRYHRLAALGH